jgi:predicted nucleic-acid-binding protein
MNKYFLDTNLFLRYLTNDNPIQAEHLEKLIKRALKGEIYLVSNTLVFTEIIWTLQSYYKYSKKSIDEVVSSIVASRALEIPEKDIILQTLEDFYSLNIDFIDAYIDAWMNENQIKDIYTLNVKDFKRIPDIRIAALTDYF